MGETRGVLRLLWLVVFSGVLSCWGGEKRASISVDNAAGVMSFRYSLGESGAKLGLPKKCGWVFGVATPPHRLCRALAAKWDDGFTIEGWACDGDALMEIELDLVAATYDEGKLTVVDNSGHPREVVGNRFANSIALLNVAKLGPSDSSALVVFKRVEAQKSQFKMVVWPTLCLEELSNEKWGREMQVP